MLPPFDPLQQEIIKNYEPKSTLGDDELAIQLLKIFIAVVAGLAVITILYHLHMDNLRMEQNQIKLIKFYEAR